MKTPINNTILSLIEHTPDGIMTDLSLRVKARRLELNLTQSALAARSGIPLPTYRRFESTGEISLRNLVSLALTLKSTDEFESLFSRPRYETIDEALASSRNRARMRGRRND